MQITRICVQAALALLCVACGGSSATPIPVPFGRYNGSWNAPKMSPPQSGTVDFALADDGSVTGTITSSAEPAAGTLTGYVHSNGKAQIVGVWDHHGVGVGWTCEGRLVFSERSSLKGVLKRNLGDFSTSVTWDLALQAASP